MSSIPGSTFERLQDIKLQTCCLVYGPSGVGKTTFALRFAPQPIAIINLDGRAKTTLNKELKRGRDIHYSYIERPKILLSPVLNKSAKQRATLKITETFDSNLRKRCFGCIQEVEQNIHAAVEDSLKPGGVRTICLDTVTELCDLYTIAIKGNYGPGEDYGRSRADINQRWLTLIETVRNSNAHFIILGREKNEWADKEPTGRKIFRGDDVIQESVDWSGRLLITTKLNVRTRIDKFEGWKLEIIKDGVQGRNTGQVITDKNWELEGLETMIENCLDDNKLEQLAHMYASCPTGPGPFVYTCMRLYPDVDYRDWL